MDSDEEGSLEGVRRRRMQKAYEEAQARAAQEEQIRSALASMLEPEAYSRLMIVRQSNPALYAQAVQSLAYLKQAGQIQGRISEKQLLAVLSKLSSHGRHDGSITFKRKGESEA